MQEEYDRLNTFQFSERYLLFSVRWLCFKPPSFFSTDHYLNQSLIPIKLALTSPILGTTVAHEEISPSIFTFDCPTDIPQGSSPWEAMSNFTVVVAPMIRLIYGQSWNRTPLPRPVCCDRFQVRWGRWAGSKHWRLPGYAAWSHCAKSAVIPGLMQQMLEDQFNAMLECRHPVAEIS